MSIYKNYDDVKNLRRVNFNMPSWLLDDVDAMADKLGLNRTSMLILMINQYIQQDSVASMAKYIPDVQKLQTELSSQSR